jgi:hypothetical protein
VICHPAKSQLSARLGLFPQQVTTRATPGLIAISKHGHRYLRKQFIHGARTVLRLVQDRNAPISQCADRLDELARM